LVRKLLLGYWSSVAPFVEHGTCCAGIVGTIPEITHMYTRITPSLWDKSICYMASILNKNGNATCNNFKDFTDLQFIEENLSFEMNSFSPNQWISHDWDAGGWIILAIGEKLTNRGR
jgi:hypothetical protein